MLRSRFGVGLAAALAVAVAVPLAAAWAQDAAKAIGYREGLMKANSWHIGPIAGMAKGDIPFDSASLQHHAEALAALSKMILEGYPEGSQGDSKAKAEIWTNWAGFEAKVQALEDASAALAAAAPTLTQETLAAALGPVGAACSGCHNDFRAK